eukprot:TRINITY_DN92634_c0_g1_i1.p1 TRINITY_DN92634_c0_g1~~TRINITY_DN92634_c0_g1_i1.p1  ORF type:complete len:264 (+),score=42.57 TRINITY_DN92634_c0_g1_i1:25-816(+)
MGCSHAISAWSSRQPHESCYPFLHRFACGEHSSQKNGQTEAAQPPLDACEKASSSAAPRELRKEAAPGDTEVKEEDVEAFDNSSSALLSSAGIICNIFTWPMSFLIGDVSPKATNLQNSSTKQAEMVIDADTDAAYLWAWSGRAAEDIPQNTSLLLLDKLPLSSTAGLLSLFLHNDAPIRECSEKHLGAFDISVTSWESGGCLRSEGIESLARTGLKRQMTLAGGFERTETIVKAGWGSTACTGGRWGRDRSWVELGVRAKLC